MKKLAALTIAFALLLCAVLPVCAASTETLKVDQNETLPIDKNVSVSVKVQPTYTVTIPAELELVNTNNTYQTTMRITVSDLLLNYNDQISIAFGSTSSEKLISQESETVDYSVTYGNNLNFKTTPCLFDKDSTDKFVDLVVVMGTPDYAGSYNGNLVFTISVISKVIPTPPTD